MAETEEETGTDEATTDEPVVAGVVYYLVQNVIRDRSNRTERAQQIGRRGFVQRFAGGSILVRRARPARITEAVLKANIEELKKAENEHRIIVTTLARQYVDLNSFNVEPLAATKPLPNPPLDSAKNDKNQGIGYNVPPNPTGTPMDAPTPELLQKESMLQPTEEPPPAPPEAPAEPVAEAPKEELPRILSGSTSATPGKKQKGRRG